MSTYQLDSIDYLKASINSIFGQSLLPSELVIVLDGLVPSVNLDFLRSLTHPSISIKIIQADKLGLAGALNVGLGHCSFDWVARMDSDDVCFENRIEKQYQYVVDNKIDLVASWHSEFADEDPYFYRLKKCPENHDNIVKELRFRNVISHPSILVRKVWLEKVNGYSIDTVPLEDYDLYYRLISKGCKLGCIQEPLVKVRVSGQIQRRNSFKIFKIDLRVKKRAYKRGNFGFFVFLKSLLILFVFRLMPLGIKKHIYQYLRS